MNPKNEWLDTEVKTLSLEARKNKADTWMVVKFLCLLFPLLLYSFFAHGSLGFSDKKVKNIQCVKQVDGGVFFTCKRCRICQWQDNNQVDWKGDFHCRKCCCKMGQE